jgi:predicted RNase H-like HicB family nuclease
VNANPPTAQELRLDVCGAAYRVVLTPDLTGGGFTVHVPELPGVHTQGDSLAEAETNAVEAIELWLEVAPGV